MGGTAAVFSRAGGSLMTYLLGDAGLFPRGAQVLSHFGQRLI